jgi:hypothetical protein
VVSSRQMRRQARRIGDRGHLGRLAARPATLIAPSAVAALLAMSSMACAQTQDQAVQPTPAATSVSPAALAQEKARQAALPGLGAEPEYLPAAPVKNYVLPALEIIGFDAVLNRVDHHFIKDTKDYDISLSSWRRNLRSSWVIDSDPFSTNQFAHPYQGAMYHGFARSAGMNYWEAAAYTFAGSMFWEIFGETTRPSRNDQVASGVAGSFLGESLFRMSNLVLEKEGRLSPFWRESAAAVISPSTGFNRTAFGERFKAVFNSHEPAYYGRLQLGAAGTTQNAAGFFTNLKRNEGQVDFLLDYGLPGKDGYKYDRPFDYFNFEANASSANGLESIFNRGLLIGRDYEVGKNYRGIWGLYGSYDYLAPQLFRVSSTALSLGSTGQWWLTNRIALQGTATSGIGYAAAGSDHFVAGQRDYNYGLAPQALLSLQMVFDERAALALNGREYYVSRVAAATGGGHENITRADASLTYRIKGAHAVALKYQWTRRDASSLAGGDQNQIRGTVGIYYTLLGKDGFGTIDWR